ncbi:hypothetical protein HPB47_020828 [Ixodes persulcatus]|uniref:Uncharacterized protein n=1 Tax=Ixodes persulcatus TaxID=34615 RepID=A0AC60QF38_IXOPE|nr:hypothetical protein HPB47_020828 [Ixodes persulcatus]
MVEVNTYQATTGSLPRGVVHGIDPLESVEEFLENSDTDYHEILQARPLGKKGTYLLTFKGDGIPKKIRYYGKLISVYAYRPTAIVCFNCHSLGHKAGICTNESRCKDCGDLCQEGHKCQKLFCYNCKGNDHVALHQLCPAKTQADLKLQQRAKAPLLNNQQRGRLRSKFEGINSFELLRTRSQSNNYPKLSRDKSTSPAPKPKAPQKTATNAQPTFAQIMKDHRESTLQLINKRKEYEKLRKKLKEEENNLSRAAMERRKEIAMVQEEIDRIDRCSSSTLFSTPPPTQAQYKLQQQQLRSTPSTSAKTNNNESSTDDYTATSRTPTTEEKIMKFMQTLQTQIQAQMQAHTEAINKRMETYEYILTQHGLSK